MFIGKAGTPSNSTPQPEALSYNEIFATMTKGGWVVSAGEGPSGVQMKRPRVMRISTKIILAVGIVGLVAAGAGIVLIILGLIDYYALTKEQSYFLNREAPALPPPPEKAKLSTFTKVLLAVFFLFVSVGLVSALFLPK